MGGEVKCFMQILWLGVGDLRDEMTEATFKKKLLE